MAVWGIGSYYKGIFNPDKTDDFIKENCAFIGWDCCNALGTGVGVKWKDNFEPMTIEITEKAFKNNVYNNTLFEEYDAEIINKLIFELIK